MDYKHKYLKYKQKYINLKHQSGGKKCSICGSEWIYKAPKGINTLCEECYKKMQNDTIYYHKLQDEAYTDILNGKLNNSIIKLKEVIRLRNDISKYLNNTLNTGHTRFANEFLPNLINELLKTKTNNKNPINVWNYEFSKLKSEID